MTASPAPTYTVALAASKAWALVLKCECGHEGRFGAKVLARYPGALSVNALAKQTVCSSCGKQGPKWHFIQDHGASRTANPIPPRFGS